MSKLTEKEIQKMRKAALDIIGADNSLSKNASKKHISKVSSKKKISLLKKISTRSSAVSKNKSRSVRKKNKSKFRMYKVEKIAKSSVFSRLLSRVWGFLKK